MKKLLFLLILPLLVILAGCSTGNLGTNSGTLTFTSTTTSATENKMLLDTNPNRNYAVFMNDSDTVMYLYPYYFTNASAASTTQMTNKGIRLNANGGTYTIDKDNPYAGQVWLATTTASKNLLIIEK